MKNNNWLYLKSYEKLGRVKNNDKRGYISLYPLLRVIYGVKYGIYGKCQRQIPHIATGYFVSVSLPYR